MRPLLDDSLKAIENLDFTNLKRKLQKPEPHGKGWSPECCDSVEKWYKRFLTLIVKHPGQKMVPNVAIDEFWHSHMTDSRAYVKDCQNIFGTYLHHNPYFGMNGDAQQRDKAFNITNMLYMQEFGEDCSLIGGNFAIECSQDDSEDWPDNACTVPLYEEV